MSRDTPTNSDDVIDSRDVIARIEELEAEREELADAVDEAQSVVTDAGLNRLDDDEFEAAQEDAKAAHIALADWDASEEAQELKDLLALQDGAEGYSDWRDGATLIRDSYFEDYAQEFAEDIGAINANASWPNSCIDWAQAASELQMDYTSVEFGDVTYWVR